MNARHRGRNEPEDPLRRGHNDFEWPSGDDEDPETPLEEDLDGEDENLPDMACPTCGQAVVEDAQKCPHCGDWITPQATGGRGRRVLFIIAVLLMLLAVLRWIL